MPDLTNAWHLPGHLPGHLTVTSAVRVLRQLRHGSGSFARACVLATRGITSPSAAGRGANQSPPGHKAC